MRKNRLDLLKTVCAAGHARAAFDSEANEGLEELREAGLLELDHTPAINPKYFTKRYRLTEAGRAVCRRLKERTEG